RPLALPPSTLLCNLLSLSHLPHHLALIPSSFFQRSAAPRALHSFPTRRSSDLGSCSPAASPRAWRRATSSSRRLAARRWSVAWRSEEHTSELQSLTNLVCRLLLEKKNRHRTVGASLLRARRTGDPALSQHVTRSAQLAHVRPEGLRDSAVILTASDRSLALHEQLI